MPRAVERRCGPEGTDDDSMVGRVGVASGDSVVGIASSEEVGLRFCSCEGSWLAVDIYVYKAVHYARRRTGK